jgi:predicted enzyme related to lactoylglutathione lyase
MTLRTTKHWNGVALKCPDSRELSRFYARLLGWRVFTDSHEWATLAPSEDAGYNLAFQTDPDFTPPVWPTEAGKQQMSMHLDIEVDDLEQSVAHAVEAGGEEASFQPQETVRVMLDPAGHPFCLYVED